MKRTKAPSSILIISFIIVLAVHIVKSVCDMYSKCGVCLKGKDLRKTVENIRRLKNKLHKPIIFLGMMGCGKSYVSSLLARKCGIKHYEMDEMLEDTQGMSIAEIFQKYGETHFRLLETELLMEILQNNSRNKEPYVISGGGGVIGNPENMKAIKDFTVSVWLKVDTRILLERVGSGEGRPILLQYGNSALAIEKLFAKRKDLYALADIHIENNGKEDIDVLTDRIIKAIIVHSDKENG